MLELPLDLGVEDTRNLEWSYSRRGVLEQCPRRYYYHYYGANATIAKAEPQKETLAFLKTLSNRHMRIGNILHLVIRFYLTKLQEGETPNLDRLLGWARGIYRRDLEYSKTRSHEMSNSSDGYDPILLLEFYYGFEDAEKLYAESEQRLLEAIDSFVGSKLFTDFHWGAARPDAHIEKRFRIELGDIPVAGQIDLAYPDGHQIAICDWKIGGSNSAQSSLQLLSYALWAVDQYQCHPNDINLYRAHLANNELRHFAASDEDLQRARARITQDVEKMRALDTYGRNGLAEAFTPCGQPRVCALCPFREVCLKEG